MYYYTFGIFTVEGLAHAILRVKGAKTQNHNYIYLCDRLILVISHTDLHHPVADSNVERTRGARPLSCEDHREYYLCKIIIIMKQWK